ncbi:zeta toxin family protein [Desulfopila sp. IMCC35008]|uniref:zeta toxin family protein n=1 Tax=Desulfopila sp. IMCC35008 TaxID=2653858 RepID=UPI0013D1AFAC|nr:zeta toxin family protein [Desulfopila sp. IMCC35008]
MTNPRQLWVLAGGNGAGKSTFYNLYLARYGIRFVNADLIAQDLDTKNQEAISYQAATLAAKIREDLLSQGISFCFETVFSHPSKIDFLAQAKANGYQITLVYIHLVDSSLNEARVRQRVSEGGHSVPPEKIHSRIPRTLQHVKTALSLVEEARIMDNSSRDNPFQQIIVMKSGTFELKTNPLPEWAKDLLPT